MAAAVFRLAVALAALGSLASAQGGLFGAMDMPHDGVSPRLYNNVPQLAKRDGAPCPAGSHRCIDIGADGQCCPNNQYCYIDPLGEPKCCAVGSKCDSECDATAYQCDVIKTVSGTVSTSTGCCGRACKSTSMFRCESELGGACCGYGSTCASGGQCRSTQTSASAVVTAIDARCSSTDEFPCPDSEGCCLSWMHCTTATGQNVCAPGNSANGYSLGPDATGGSSSDGGGGGGLSTGAKAGIGAGVAIGVAVVLGAVLWICIARRRRQRQPSERSSQQLPHGQGPVAGSPRAVSEVTSDITRNSRLRGLAQDYFGPRAVPGPYTDTETALSPSSSPGISGRGVPVQAHSPNDITAPVEIDSRVSQGLKEEVIVTSRPIPSPVREETHGRFELDGGGVVAQLDTIPSPASNTDSPTYQEPGPGGVPYRRF
ncbi:hypothetical protein F5X68DRAFT_70892 [Plectosphaerella plurivora]|uniref:Uncharacterized protein n=1 Tax=Plectosphaerella plurivora TaxID=936078 RepID=A0A9P9AEW7_9PEZI|nr:hypothetical protein F5X68DRAFT_70892 [Plectosphaerella plurivora]